jgi:hypothetical protein
MLKRQDHPLQTIRPDLELVFDLPRPLRAKHLQDRRRCTIARVGSFSQESVLMVQALNAAKAIGTHKPKTRHIPKTLRHWNRKIQAARGKSKITTASIKATQIEVEDRTAYAKRAAAKARISKSRAGTKPQRNRHRPQTPQTQTPTKPASGKMPNNKPVTTTMNVSRNTSSLVRAAKVGTRAVIIQLIRFTVRPFP